MNLVEIRDNIFNQDNRATANPCYVVQNKRRIYHMDVEHAYDWIWWHECDGFEETDPKIINDLNFDLENHRVIKDYIQLGYQDIWEFVTCCFTEAGANKYILENKHNLREPRVYVESFNRNTEMLTVLNHLTQSPLG